MEAENQQESAPLEAWQVSVNGQIYETNLDEMKDWIAEGALQPGDKVRRGNLRWLDAQKVPLLHGFFNAKEFGIEFRGSKVRTNTSTQPNRPDVESIPTTTQRHELSLTSTNFVLAANENEPIEEIRICSIHSYNEPSFVCEICLNEFCEKCLQGDDCPKACPMCGANCNPLPKIIDVRNTHPAIYYPPAAPFGFSDFGKALAYPFKFKASLIFGGLMFMFFTLGQSATAFGGIYLIVGAIVAAMLANTLTFGIMANTADNFSQGKIDLNFMPSFDEFSTWDDVIHPFFLSIGVSIVSFGPLILVILALLFFVSGGQKPISPYLIDGVDNSTASGNSDAKLQVKSITGNIANKTSEHNEQIESLEKDGVQPASAENDEEKQFEEMNRKIATARKAELEAAFGKTPDTKRAEVSALAQRILGAAVPFLVLGGLGLLWALFYFPAACAVAAYSRSFASTLNPSIGLDTVKRLGADYAKILFMCFILSIFSAAGTVALRIVFLAFDLPGIGNLPAIAAGSLLTFYLSIVFSVTLGFALYKNADKLQLFR